MKKLLLLTTLPLIFASCVSMQKYNDLKSKYDQSSLQAAALEKENQEKGVQINELNAQIEQQKEQLAKLQNEYDDMEAGYKLAKANLENLQKEYDELNDKFSTALAGNRSENQKLLKELQDARDNLIKREAEVAAKQKELDQKQRDLDKLLADFREKEQRVNELQAILDNKDAELKALRDKVMEALLGFKDKGLTVYTKNGKVYVSMAEKLLFASGSWQVGDEGKRAIREVASVLAKNPDINVMVEGHTDNVPFNGRGDAKDNLDLSVMRATAISKVLLENKGVEKSSVVSAGRGDSSPVVENDSPENRAKNRRSEIILTPKLDELLNILGN
ncbi:MAG: OmpA family protein [Bacteroidales bacterium]|jgi:chemotaxis protein MotB|nr:OmpA family protein [Bacteroidales bacterium]